MEIRVSAFARGPPPGRREGGRLGVSPAPRRGGGAGGGGGAGAGPARPPPRREGVHPILMENFDPRILSHGVSRRPVQKRHLDASQQLLGLKGSKQKIIGATFQPAR